jgi:hypothetical protein
MPGITAGQNVIAFHAAHINRALKAIALALLVVALIPPSNASAKQAAAFPNDLFDVKLGGIYKLGKGQTPYDVGSLPVSKFTAIQRYLGSGLHYFFKPLKEHKAFDYIERRYHLDDEHYETSFRLYLLPVISKKITLRKELENIEWDWTVMLIEWSSQSREYEDAYYWASSLCKNMESDLALAPQITADFESKKYNCTFKEGDRKLEIKAVEGSKFYKLSRTQLALDKNNDAVDATFRKLRTNERKLSLR